MGGDLLRLEIGRTNAHGTITQPDAVLAIPWQVVLAGVGADLRPTASSRAPRRDDASAAGTHKDPAKKPGNGGALARLG